MSQSTRGVFIWLLLLCVVVGVHTAVVVTATSPFSAHGRGHTIGVTIDCGVFFCLLHACVSAVTVVFHTYCCSSHCCITVFGPCSRAHDRCHNRPQCVFLPPPRVSLRVNFGYPITYVIGSAGCGVFPLWFVMPCYAHCQVASVVCPTTSYLQQRGLGLLIFIEEPRFCGHTPLCAVKTLLYENQQP